MLKEALNRRSGSIAPLFLTWALDEDEWLAARSGRFTLETSPGTHFIGGCVFPRDRLGVMKDERTFLTPAGNRTTVIRSAVAPTEES
jgi:hypothetical protein